MAKSLIAGLGALTAVLLFGLPAAAGGGGGGPGGGLGLVPAIALAVGAASILAYLFDRLKLPALLAYIVAGLLLGTFAGGLFGATGGTLNDISHLGLVFLLFIIGLEMDLGGIFRLGPRAAVAILLQAPIALATVYALQLVLHKSGIHLPGLADNPDGFFYYAMATALGSTAVVVKLLGDKFDLSSQAGKITVLTLIAEDICAVAALSYVASQSGGGGSALVMLGGGFGLTVFFVVFARYALSRVIESLARSPDLLALVSIGWCFFCAESLAMVGLSAEMGALVAGLTLGKLPQSTEILAKVSSLRDFFMALFFVALGMSLPPPTLAIMGESAVLVVVVILVRLLPYAPSLLWARLGPVVSLTVPINLAQLSEFALLIVPIGVANGALAPHDQTVISYALMLSVVISAFTIANNYSIALFIQNKLGLESRTVTVTSPSGDDHGGGEIVLLGYFLNAEALGEELRAVRPDLLERVLVVDFNVQNHEKVLASGMRVLYGDIGNPETLRHLGIAQAKVVMSTISNAFLRGITNEQLLATVRAINPDARFIGTAASAKSADELVDLGSFACVAPPAEAGPAYVKALVAALDAAERREPTDDGGSEVDT